MTAALILVAHAAYLAFLGFPSWVKPETLLGGGGLIGAVVSLAGFVGPWLRARSSEQKRLQLLDQAAKQVSFWELWLRAQQLAQPSDRFEAIKSIVQRELDAASQTVLKATTQVPSAASAAAMLAPAGARPSGIRRWLLLYRPPRAWAWIPRVFFYMYAFYFVFLPLSWIFPGFLSRGNASSEVSLWITSLFLMLFFRYLSVRSERPKAASRTTIQEDKKSAAAGRG